jgi:endonuclease/exonuclease/phosphatase family metal-dependent hydrolase
MRWWLAAAIVALAFVSRCTCGGDREATVRIATFNIEHFPKDRRQVDGAFDQIVAAHANLVAAEEITDPALFGSEARRRLGPSWKFTFDAPRIERHHHIGVLFDRDAWDLVSTTEHGGTNLGPRDHNILEVRLAPKAGGTIVRVLVIHFRPGTAGRPIRARQFAAVEAVASAAKRSGDRVVLLGDFNATEDADRTDLAALARKAELRWATADLPCTAFWKRDDGCPRSRLDHVLTSEPPHRAAAAGACATEGCDWQKSCPLYVDEVSDHCPVIVDF